MSQVITGQVLFVLLSLCSGMLLMVGYDVLRLLRWFVAHNRISIWIEDILYWCLAALPILWLFFQYNEGIIRCYGLLGMIAGAVLYEAGISRPLRKIIRPPMNLIRQKILAKIIKKVPIRDCENCKKGV